MKILTKHNSISKLSPNDLNLGFDTNNYKNKLKEAKKQGIKDNRTCGGCYM